MLIVCGPKYLCLIEGNGGCLTAEASAWNPVARSPVVGADGFRWLWATEVSTEGRFVDCAGREFARDGATDESRSPADFAAAEPAAVGDFSPAVLGVALWPVLPVSRPTRPPPRGREGRCCI